MFDDRLAKDQPDGPIYYGSIIFSLFSVLSGLVLFYCFSESLANVLPARIVRLFDLTENGNLFQWFLTALWLKIAVDSRMIYLLTANLIKTRFMRLFWLLFAGLAVFLSVDSVCSLGFILLDSGKEYLNSFELEKETFVFLVWTIRFSVWIVVLSVVCLLFQSVSAFKRRKLILNSLFAISFLSFGVAVLVRCPSQTSQNAAFSKIMLAKNESEPNVPSDSTNPEFAANSRTGKTVRSSANGTTNDSNLSDSSETPKIASHSRSGVFQNVSQSRSVENESTNGATNSPNEARNGSATSQTESSNRNDVAKSNSNPSDEDSGKTTNNPSTVSPESSEAAENPSTKRLESESPTAENLAASDSTTQNETRLENVLGWDKSLEENLHLSQSVEDLFGMSDSLESRLVPAGATFDVRRLNVALHYGTYGLSVVLFYIATFLTLYSVRRDCHWERQNQVRQKMLLLSQNLEKDG